MPDNLPSSIDEIAGFSDIVTQVPVTDSESISLATTRVYINANGQAFFQIPLSSFYDIISASQEEVADYARRVEELYQKLIDAEEGLLSGENLLWGEF